MFLSDFQLEGRKFLLDTKFVEPYTIAYTMDFDKPNLIWSFDFRLEPYFPVTICCSPKNSSL